MNEIELQFTFRATVPKGMTVAELTETLKALLDPSTFRYNKDFGVSVQLPIVFGEEQDD